MTSESKRKMERHNLKVARQNAQSEAAAKLYREGMTYRQIAAQMGATVSETKTRVRLGLGQSPKEYRHGVVK